MATTTQIVYARQPAEFVFGDDFDLFWERFSAFLIAAKCEKKSEYSLFLSYLDARSFRRARSIAFTDEEKTAGEVDLTKSFDKIKEALTKTPAVPEKIELRYRSQKSTETLGEFGDAVRQLGIKVYGSQAVDTSANVIESFCAGVFDPELGSKLLQKKFETLAAAIQFAVTKKESSNIKKYLAEKRGKSDNFHDVSVLPVVQEDQPGPSGLNNNFHRQARAQDQNKVSSGNVTPRNFICFNCGTPGHIRKDCRKPPQNAGRNTSNSDKSRGSITCYQCGEIGHIARFCRKRQFTAPGRGRNGNFRGGPGNTYRSRGQSSWPTNR